jgi:predicted component of type VI protein secretion system
MKNYSLIVSVPDSEPTLFELRGDRVGLGRELDNQIRLKMNEVSSSHCEFRKLDGGGYEVVDLDSTNGTRVNGKQIEKHTLADGDRLLIGEVVPVHFVALAEGQKPEAVAVEAGEGGKIAAAAYTQLDEKLQSIEANIVVKASELEALQKAHDDKLAEYGRMAASLRDLEAQIAAKKASGEDAEEIRRMELDLMTQTRRVQVLRTDLDGQAQQLQALQGGAPVPVTPAVAAAHRIVPQPVVPVPMSPTPPPQAQPVQPAQAPQPVPVVQPIQAQPAQPVAAVPPAQASPPTPPADPAQPAAPIAVPVATPLVTPTVAAGPKTALLVPGAPPGGPKTKRLLVEEPTKPKAKLNYGNDQQS